MHNLYLPRGNLDLIVIGGPDAAKLLQGQLTCDVAAVPDPGSTRGALCNNKGRVLATFILVHHGAAFYLVMNAGLGAVVTMALKKYLPFYKCELRSLSGSDSCSGVRGDAILAAIGINAVPLESGQCVDIADGWVCNVDKAQQQYLVYARTAAPIAAGITIGADTDWLIAGMQSGQFPFCTTDVEKYTPQEILLDRHGYISFTKGCYTGQEIVARMHYRGKLKKVLFLLQAASREIPAEPMEILDPDNQVLGATLKLFESHGVIYGLALMPADLENELPRGVKNRAGLAFDLRVF